MRVLVIEDDDVLRDGLDAGLSLKGFTIDAVGNLADAQSAVDGAHYDAVVLDLTLPDGSGADLLQAWRQSGRLLPVLLLTARNGVQDRVEGLNCGADDYLGKPFDIEELTARIHAIVRRAKGLASATLVWRDIVMDIGERTVRKAEVPVSLSRREFAVLQKLMEQRGRVHSRAQIEERLYGWNEEVESNAIEVHVHNLRAKLGRELIETVRGEGYRVPRS